MAAEHNFSVDITVRDELGNSAMWHARADTAADFLANVAELVAQQPQLKTFVYSRRADQGIAPSPQGSADMQPAAVLARAASVAGDMEAVCPVHHTSRPSNFGGVFCPGIDESAANGRCGWTHGKTPRKARAA